MRRLPALMAVSVLLGCGGSASSGGETGLEADTGTPETEAGAASEAGTSGDDAGESGEGGASTTDGTPSYTAACTPLKSQVGKIVNTTHGRLDGTLAYIVPQSGTPACNGDDSHVHLQIRAAGLIYDVAVDIGKFTGDANLYEADMAMPSVPWSEGWHDVSVSYPQLGIHSTQFTAEEPAALGQKIISELANVNHVSVFGDGYPSGNGCHDVHYEDGVNDGALVIEPLSPTAHILFFRFSTQSF